MSTLTTIDKAGHRLMPDAAASFARMQKARGSAFHVTSAYRSTADQQVLYDGYKAGKPGYNFALPPSQSNHCRGEAVDFGSADYAWLEAHAAAYGWIQDKNERWHYDYVPSRDTHKPAPSKPAKASSSVLKKGSTGTKVKNLQRGLNKKFPAYAKLAVDGIFGPKVEAAVREFQKRAGLVVDGIVGPKTVAALKTYGVTL
ncbi:hypothetical protein GCM10025864_44620 [Luteimicrobium album]|uniref:Uncharacterized protein n=1 Tax=Luteimicrobium album TaxID=1054550 RepID=A0ABQ6I984_9MICO|nr:peptidoglycan-binding protein [Luteimicrobium album]GMA22297.1 hypothetical protein GCM10025864_00560 [Luteimicrobium album]GMA26703.1 hypothetical protein GCM10025864_44620 [Luteimicrobium album]